MAEITKKAPSVLIVDDDESIRVLLKKQMQADGYTVSTMDNGRDAITAAVESPPDVVLLDALMPATSGFEVAEVLKSTEATRNVPIIMVTASKEVDLVKKSFSSGCVLFLPKPFTAASLLSLLQLVLK